MASTWVGWIVWLYLWRPALTLVLWLLGVEVFGYQWIGLSGWKGLIEFAIYTMPFGMGLCAILVIWASANYVRFRGKERRQARPAPSVEADCQWTKATAADLIAGRGLKNMVCRHDEHGLLIGVEPHVYEAADSWTLVLERARDTGPVVPQETPTL